VIAPKYAILIIINMVVSAIPPFIMEVYYLGVALNWNPLGLSSVQFLLDISAILHPWMQIGSWLLFPFNLLAFFYLYAFSSIKISKFFLFFEKKLHPPKEGIFPRDFSNKDFYHWHARRAIKKFPCWLLKLVPFTWMKMKYIHNQLGAKIGNDVGLLDSWIDLEFVTIEDGVAIGRGAAVTNHFFTSEALIIKRVHVKKDAIIGERVRITPGSIIGEKSTLLIRSTLGLGTIVPDGAFFKGNPAKQVEKPT
jgi:acetyltransferase-like isoleucine patch superfamily enzyme